MVVLVVPLWFFILIGVEYPFNCIRTWIDYHVPVVLKDFSFIFYVSPLKFVAWSLLTLWNYNSKNIYTWIDSMKFWTEVLYVHFWHLPGYNTLYLPKIMLQLRSSSDLLKDLDAGVELATAAVPHPFLPLCGAANIVKVWWLFHDTICHGHVSRALSYSVLFACRMWLL